MDLTRVKFEDFSVFDDLDLELSPGINVLVGANGTGKTHLMKACYAACDISTTGVSLSEKLVDVFLPSHRLLGRLAKRDGESKTATIQIFQDELEIRISFSRHGIGRHSTRTNGGRSWVESHIESVYIPVKEMLANAPGFRSLYARREIHFEAVYADILDRAYLPPLRDPLDPSMTHLLTKLREAIGGRVNIRDDEFLLRTRQGTFEFTLLAEGIRKLGLLWLLIQNGALRDGSILFWDEPETNLNPKLYGVLMDVLLELQRHGVQVFFATHDYVILKELDLQKKGDDQVAFHSLYRTPEGRVACDTANSYLGIHPNAIAEAFSDIYDREIKRSLKGIAQ